MIRRVDTHKPVFAALIHSKSLPKTLDSGVEFETIDTPKTNPLNEKKVRSNILSHGLSFVELRQIEKNLIHKRISSKLAFIKPNFHSYKLPVAQLPKVNGSKASTANDFLEIVSRCFDLFVSENFLCIPISNIRRHS